MKKLLLTLMMTLFATAALAQEVSQPALQQALLNAFEVSYGDAEQAVAAALNQQGIGDKLQVTISGRRTNALFAYSKPLTVQVRGLNLARMDHRWSASLLFVSGNEVVSALPVNGHFDEIIELPVLKREVRAGDIITAADVEIRDFSMAHTRTDTVTDMSELIGKSPTHNMSPSRPIREHEIANPIAVKKNALVDMRFISPGMQITATGEAMSDGAVGDVITVRNSASKRVVRAVIADNKTVNIIAPGTTETSQLTGSAYGTN